MENNGQEDHSIANKYNRPPLPEREVFVPPGGLNPDVKRLGLPERPDVKVSARISIWVTEPDKSIATELAEEVSVPWNDGPVSLGWAMAEVAGELSKKVWGLGR